ncbi:hypothetical protein CN445_29235 [Bacillus cereus]|uniref:hypothetical protein n=1 Tax=Bacillus nitratireducens TaxID=2026193 RepID=UPI000BEC739C|nr:hypothetical protein [Bacillus nitratireducens]PEE15485.1 hypothetical protein CON53_24265 [Bacillus cereus]MED0906474.1 hypothetical protein [Bacillus nitratireducens]PES76727.1 hypothetical protein CN509_16485 [Bacillus cereus]PET08987.1 hypothetical protein CN505_03965 [Bacillus cereus]PEW81593.1 hypothetical protein CN445_29235 [Bacillus cereus]
MKKVIATIFIVGFSVILLYLFTDVFTKIQIRKPVGDNLKEHYGIKDGDFKILSAYDNRLGGTGIYTYIEIKKPYYTTTYLTVDRNSYEIDEDDDKYVFLDIFKGAYVQQHSDVIKQSNEIIKRYNLLSESNNAFDKGKQNFYYYLNFTIDEQQEKELLTKFKQSKQLDTKKLIKTLKMSESKINSYHMGVVNFNYYYSVEKNKGNIPDILSIMNDFNRSNVLTEGIYNIVLQPSSSSGVDDGKESYVLFSVDKSGEFKVIEKNEYGG